VASVCNLSYSGGRDQENLISGQGQPSQKVSETPCQEISLAWWCTSIVLATQEAEVGESHARLAWAKTRDPP
jgi:hypothetical protein